jgi:hypothetical protein
MVYGSILFISLMGLVDIDTRRSALGAEFFFRREPADLRE